MACTGHTKVDTVAQSNLSDPWARLRSACKSYRHERRLEGKPTQLTRRFMTCANHWGRANGTPRARKVTDNYKDTSVAYLGADIYRLLHNLIPHLLACLSTLPAAVKDPT